ncbi:hypothetical protein T492DRAFT_1141679 [Pavlovales sp. CCMP2436]|nr:hypothetical protein T492DRAFT_1141679 [Pavlovales sp. CCMP2436]
MQSSIDGVVETADMEPPPSQMPGKQSSIGRVVDMQSSIDGVVDMQSLVDVVVDMQSLVDGVVEAADNETTQSAELSAQIEPGKKPNVLVVMATGKMGLSACAAFVAAGHAVFGTSRDGDHIGLTGLGATPIGPFQLGDKASMLHALKVSQAGIVFLNTLPIDANEVAQGAAMLAACKESNVGHVIYCSVSHCDICPADVTILSAKFEIEKLAAKENLRALTILRPVSYFENVHDAASQNPLKKVIIILNQNPPPEPIHPGEASSI